MTTAEKYRKTAEKKLKRIIPLHPNSDAMCHVRELLTRLGRSHGFLEGSQQSKTLFQEWKHGATYCRDFLHFMGPPWMMGYLPKITTQVMQLEKKAQKNGMPIFVIEKQ